MKRIFQTTLFAASLFIAAQSHAQTQKDTTVGQKIGSTAKKVGRATSSAAKTVGHATSTAAKDAAHETSSAAKDVGQATSKTATKVGHKTAEVASKGKSAVVDKKFESKVGPSGQTIYIDKNAAYYYVDTKGHRVYVPEAELQDRPVE
jgi:hypothetical protein